MSNDSPETGWLIERRDTSTWYFSLRILPTGSWELDASYGLRFGRRSDAEEYVRARGLPERGEEIHIGEHMWMDAAMVEEARAEALADARIARLTDPNQARDGED